MKCNGAIHVDVFRIHISPVVVHQAQTMHRKKGKGGGKSPKKGGSSPMDEIKPPKFVLNMICKNEAHIICEAFDSIVDHIDGWVIVDTGSTDGTQDMIRAYFEGKGIDGELREIPWVKYQDRGDSVSCEFEKARSDACTAAFEWVNASEERKNAGEWYAWVLDADDYVASRPVWPAQMIADGYNIVIRENEVRYGRTALMRVACRWQFHGWRHELPFTKRPMRPELGWPTIESLVHASRRMGDRSKDLQKYRNDALCISEECEAKGEYNARRIYYIAQSWWDYAKMLRDANSDNASINTAIGKALKFYRLRLKQKGYIGEQFDANMKIYEILRDNTNAPWREQKAALIAATKADTSRAEAHYELVSQIRYLTDASADPDRGPDPAGFKEAYELGRAGLSRKLKNDFHLGAPWIYEWGLKDQVAACGIYSKYKPYIKNGLKLCEELLASGMLPTDQVAHVKLNAFHACKFLGIDLPPFPEGEGELLDPSLVHGGETPPPALELGSSDDEGGDAFDWGTFNNAPQKADGMTEAQSPRKRSFTPSPFPFPSPSPSPSPSLLSPSPPSSHGSPTKAEAAFSDVYARSVWTEGSGPGSTLAFNQDAYMPFVSGLVRTLPINRIVDLGCGDWQFSRHLILPLCASIHGLRYDGFDCVRKLVDVNNATFATEQVKFHHIDLTKPGAIDRIPDADIVLVKDVLQHLPDEDVARITSELSARFNVVIITNCMSKGMVPDIPVGDWRKLNSEHYPLSAAHAERLFTFHGKEVAVCGKFRDWFVAPNVPRNIFMTWRDFRTAPPLIDRCVKSWVKRAPGFEPHTFDDEMCERWFVEHAPRLLDVYLALSQPIQKADFWRLAVLALEGGIYTDVDVECIESPDRLLEAIDRLEFGKKWSVAMPQNHPLHDPGHELDLMNNVIVAKPRAPFLVAALGAVTLATASRVSSAGVLETTGPRFLRRLHEAMEKSAVRVIPWQWVNPIPDLCTTEDSELSKIPELRTFYEGLLRTGDFRTRLSPFAVHYWWHTYWKDESIVASADALVGPTSRIDIDSRIARFHGWLGGRAATFAAAFAHVAEKIEAKASPVVVEWGTVRSFVGHGPGVMSTDSALWDPSRPHAWDWGAGSFLRVFCEVFDGFGDAVSFTSVDPDADAQKIAGVVAADFPFVELRAELSGDYMDGWQTSCGRQIDLLYMDHGDSGEACTRLHIDDAKRIVEMGIVAPGGLILIDDMDFPPAKGLLSLPFFLKNGFAVRQWSDKQVLLQRCCNGGGTPDEVLQNPPAWTESVPGLMELVEDGVTGKLDAEAWLEQKVGENQADPSAVLVKELQTVFDERGEECAEEMLRKHDRPFYATLSPGPLLHMVSMLFDVKKCRGAKDLFHVMPRALPLHGCAAQKDKEGLPSVLVAILARNKAFVLKPYLESIVSINYPKDKLHLWIRTNDNSDETADILVAFVRTHAKQYASVEIDTSPLAHRAAEVMDKDGNPPLPNTHEWTQARFKLLGSIRQASLEATLRKKCDFYYVADVDNFVTAEWLREGISLNLPIVAPLLGCTGDSYYANMHAAVSSDGMYADDPFYHAICDRKIKGIIDVPVVHCTYLVRADVIPSLTYDDGTGRFEYAIFSDSARKAGVQQYIDNRRFWGVLTFADGHPDNGGPNLPRCVNPWRISQMHKLPYDVKAHRAFLSM